MSGYKTKAYYFSHDCNAKDDFKCMQLIDELGLESYGIFWVLIETLREQKNYKYIGSLARKYATTKQKMEVVVLNYDLFILDEESLFFSISLNKCMEAFEALREKNSRAGKKVYKEEKKKLKDR